MKTNFINSRTGLVILFSLILFSTFSLVEAAPPIKQVTTIIDKGIEIEVPIMGTIQQNMPFKFHIHAHNATDGLLLRDDVIDYCNIHLYDPTTGGHLIEDNMSFDSNNMDWEYYVEGGNFTKIGQYAILFYCEVSDEIGGFFEYPFFITVEGITLDEVSTDLNTTYIWIILVLLYGIAFIGFFGKNDVVAIFGGMGMMAFGIIIMSQGILIFENYVTRIIAYLTIGLGAFFAIASGVNMNEN